jgi:hypothetical protein
MCVVSAQEWYSIVLEYWDLCFVLGQINVWEQFLLKDLKFLEESLQKFKIV